MDATSIECIRSTASAESLRSAEQRADDRRRLDRTLRREWASEQNANRSIRIDFACYRHGVLLQERRGTPVPVVGEQSSPLGMPSRLMTRRRWISRVAAREKEKAPGPCELRALLRDEPSNHARGTAEGASHGTAGPSDPTAPAMLGRY